MVKNKNILPDLEKETLRQEIDSSWDLIGYCLRKMYEIDAESPSVYYKDMATAQMERLVELLKSLNN